jgi:hypothetical protein
MREIGKEGRVARLSKASWNITIPYDSDPNQAIFKMQARIAELENRSAPVQQTPQQPHHACNFDGNKLKSMIKESMEEALRPFIGG